MTKKDWHSYNSFKFSKGQIKWGLANIVTLRNGVWPASHKDTGYTGEAHSKQVSHEGNFVKAALIAAEIDLRIQRAGLDGLLMEFLYAFESADEIFVIEHLAQCLNLGRQEVFQRIQNALRYVSGNGRKITSYKQYIRNLKSERLV